MLFKIKEKILKKKLIFQIYSYLKISIVIDQLSRQQHQD